MALSHQIAYTDRKKPKSSHEAPDRPAARVSSPVAPVESVAAPSVVRRGRGRPKGPAKPELWNLAIGLPPDLVEWLDVEWRRRGLASRVDLIRAILAEARAGN